MTSAASIPAAADRPLAGQTALVTGAGRGLGHVVARRLARAGARVALVARSRPALETVATELRSLGADVAVLPCDVTDAGAVDRRMADAESALGPLDLVVNNAGEWLEPGPLWTADPEAWWRVQEVNVRGVFLGMAAALRRMVPRGRGRVVNVSSRIGNRAVPYASAYATSKTSVTRLTEIAAAEAAPHGVRVFALEPGAMRTAMTDALIASEGARRWIPWYAESFARGEAVTPDEAAALVLRIACGDADALSGRLLSRADDLDALVGEAEAIARDERLVLRLAR